MLLCVNLLGRPVLRRARSYQPADQRCAAQGSVSGCQHLSCSSINVFCVHGKDSVSECVIFIYFARDILVCGVNGCASESSSRPAAKSVPGCLGKAACGWPMTRVDQMPSMLLLSYPVYVLNLQMRSSLHCVQKYTLHLQQCRDFLKRDIRM